MTDAELLRRYTDEGSQLAFGELVARHMDWVHSAAVRLSGDHHQADDVTQAVFIALCRRAGSLRMDRPLCPWLFRVARNASRPSPAVMHRRRRHHEQRAAAMKAESASSVIVEEQWGRPKGSGVVRRGRRRCSPAG